LRHWDQLFIRTTPDVLWFLRAIPVIKGLHNEKYAKGDTLKVGQPHFFSSLSLLYAKQAFLYGLICTTPS